MKIEIEEMLIRIRETDKIDAELTLLNDIARWEFPCVSYNTTKAVSLDEVRNQIAAIAIA